LLSVNVKSDETNAVGLTVRAVEWQPIQVDVRCTNDSIVVLARTGGRTVKTVGGCMPVGGTGNCELTSW